MRSLSAERKLGADTVGCDFAVGFYFCRRQMLKALAAEQSTTVSNDTNDESVSCQDSMQLLPDSMDSTFSTGDTLCLQPISIIKA
ncbi:uncharacterized protein LOC118648062 isoform X2 [Monomorium pharaonis]|uniref:uncharacterized protein LOC118648062 isoform X2 n=1 Tax=Monomorium pharaonis TaxID=307658 RepID=UPI0017468AAF|nr:uncharacterized protein LOC118648062 isoform X2 [Monomorium pharaonis]